MRYYDDFVDGVITKHILYALADCTASEIAQLRSTGALAPNRGNDATYLSYRNLKYAALDDYADVSEHTMRELIFGSNDKPVTYYSAIDAAVIAALDSLGESQLDAMLWVMKKAHCTDLMTSNNMDPSHRYITFYQTRKSPLPTEIPEGEQYKYSKNVMQEIERFKKSKRSIYFRFASDYWPDLATVMGISLHWVLGIQRHPLFCETAAGDQLFDYFTLMEPAGKKMFVGYLLRLMDKPDDTLAAYYNSGREGV